MKKECESKQERTTMESNKEDRLTQSTSYKIGKLQQQIGDAKKVVEELLKRKNETQDKSELEKINKEKKERIKLLKRLAKRLREVYKETKKERELKSAGDILDGIAYHKAKKSKNPEGMPKVRKIRAAREEARKRYLGYLNKEEEYYRLDPYEVPGSLFLHEKIINKYGLMPEEYLKFEEVDEQEEEEDVSDLPKVEDDEVKECEEKGQVDERTRWIKEKRLEWLRSKEDGGELYFKLREEIFERQELNKLESEREKLEQRIDAMIKEGLTGNQMEMYEKSNEFMHIWCRTKIKTKKMKERYKLLLHALATLKSETCLPIEEFFQLVFKTTIITNDYDVKVSLKNKNLYVIDQVNVMLEDLKRLRDEIEMKSKYWINSNKYLKNELYMYLTGEKVFRGPVINERNDGIKQTGKYFERWIKLSVEQQGERFESYARWYVEKNLIGKNLIPAERRLEMVEKLATLLHESYKVKHMIYRDFAWKTKSGMIETVKILQYDKDTGEFKLKFSKKPKVINEEKAAAKAKKKAAKEEGESVFSEEESIQRINDVMLRYIIETKCYKETVKEEETKVHKNKCLNLVKKEFNVKSVSALDRQKVFVKFTDMCHDISKSVEES